MSEPYPLLTVCPVRPQLARRRRVGAASAPHLRRAIGAPSRRASDDRARDDDGDRARDDEGARANDDAGDAASTTTARRIESRAPSSSNEASIGTSIERRCSRRARAGRRRADARREIESTRAWTRWCAR
jgi:hypothetical protein